MEGRTTILKFGTENKKPSKIFSSTSNKRYYIGYKDGKLETRKSTNFVKENEYSDLGNILEIVSDDKDFIIVANS